MSKDNNEPTDNTNTDCGPGSSEVSVGNSELEAPRKPRSAAQIAAFAKARAKRAENMASKNIGKTPPSTPCGAPSPSSQGAQGTISEKKPRKPRSDKGKSRGYLVRQPRQIKEREQPDSDSDDDVGVDSRVAYSYYNQFVIV